MCVRVIECVSDGAERWGLPLFLGFTCLCPFTYHPLFCLLPHSLTPTHITTTNLLTLQHNTLIFNTTCSVLRSVLPDRGYTAHVLGYTAAALLEAHVKHTPGGVGVGQLDACVEPLLPTLEGDLFGEVGLGFRDWVWVCLCLNAC